MVTDFFAEKERGFRAVSIILVVFILLSIVYSRFLCQVEKIDVRKRFYFLVAQTTHVDAAIYNANLNGGAGYLLQYKGEEYVAFSVYLNDLECSAAQNALAQDAQLLSIYIESLYFKGYREKENKMIYRNALECVYNCIEVLQLEINRLDNGATQQSSARTLAILLRQLQYLSSKLFKSYKDCADACRRVADQLRTIISNVIYVKELRYLLCELTMQYIGLTSQFSL